MVTPTPRSQVVPDSGKNKVMMIYLGCLAVAGVVVMVLTHLKGWGFWGWFGGGFLIVAGGGGLGSAAKTGGAGKFDCPNCGETIKVLHITEERTLPCPGCKTYLEGAHEMKPVPEQRITKFPAFEAWLPEAFHWPEGCTVCDNTASRTVEVESSGNVSMLSMVSPISVSKVSKITAPACPKHQDGVALFRTSQGTTIAFRSLAYFRSFCRLNSVEASGTIAGEPVGSPGREAAVQAIRKSAPKATRG
jgi:hypothetical protein